MNKGLYCEVHGDFTLSPRQVSRIEQRMREIVERNEPFERFTVDKEEAKRIFQDMGFMIRSRYWNTGRNKLLIYTAAGG
jgi:uridine kinase